jgi:hypothetical protein
MRRAVKAARARGGYAAVIVLALPLPFRKCVPVTVSGPNSPPTRPGCDRCERFVAAVVRR